MKEDTKEALKQFALLDTLYSGHPADQERFLNFVVAAFRNEERKITHPEFLETIKEIRNGENINEEEISSLYSEYENALDVLNYYTKSSV